MPWSCCTTSLVELCEGSSRPQELGEPTAWLINEPPRFLSSSMEMSYLHVSLVHSALTSSGLPEAAGCFPGFTCTAAEGRRRRAAGLPGLSGPRLQVARRPWQRCGLPGAVPRSGAESGPGERGQGEEPGGRCALPQAQVLLAGVSKTHSFSAQLFLASCRAASCLSLSSRSLLLLPALT